MVSVNILLCFAVCSFSTSLRHNGKLSVSSKINSAAQNLSIAKTTTPSESITNLNKIFENISVEEKYSILLETYSKELNDEQSFDKRSQLFSTIDTLYSEFVQISPNLSTKPSYSYINAASQLSDSMLFSNALQVARSAGGIRRFGLAINQLTSPSSPIRSDVEVPKDDRDKEVLYAVIVSSFIALFLASQVTWITPHLARLLLISSTIICVGSRELC